jgi:hypothetical protein
MFVVDKDKKKDKFTKAKNGTSQINKKEYSMPISILADEEKLERDRIYYYPNSSVNVENVTIRSEDPLRFKAFYKENVEAYEKISNCVKLLISFSPSLSSYRSGIGNLVKIKGTSKNLEEKNLLKVEDNKNEINVNRNFANVEKSIPNPEKIPEYHEKNTEMILEDETSDKINVEEVQNNLTELTVVKGPYEKSFEELIGDIPTKNDKLDEDLIFSIDGQDKLDCNFSMKQEIEINKELKNLPNENIILDECQPSKNDFMENKEAFVMPHDRNLNQDLNFSLTNKNNKENIYSIECIENKEIQSKLILPEEIPKLIPNPTEINEVEIKEKNCILTCMSLIKFSEIKSNDDIGKSQIYMYTGDSKNIKTFFKKLDFIVENPSIEEKFNYLKSVKDEYNLVKLKIDFSALNSRSEFIEADSNADFSYLSKDPKRKIKIFPGLDVMILHPVNEQEDFYSPDSIEIDLDFYINPKYIEESYKEEFVTFLTHHIPRALNHEYFGKTKMINEIMKTVSKEGLNAEIKRNDKIISYEDQRDLEFAKSCCIYYDRSINFGKIDPRNMGGIRIGYYIFNSFSTGTILYDSEMKPFGISYYGSFDYYPPSEKKVLYNLLIPFSHPGIIYTMRKFLFPEDDINICEFIRNSQSFKFYEEFKKCHPQIEEKDIVNKPNEVILSDNDAEEIKMEEEKISEKSQQNENSENDSQCERESDTQPEKEKSNEEESPQEEAKLEKSSSRGRPKKKSKTMRKNSVNKETLSAQDKSPNPKKPEPKEVKRKRLNKVTSKNGKFLAKRTSSKSKGKSQEKLSKSKDSKSKKSANQKTNSKTQSKEDQNIYSLPYFNKREKANENILKESEEQISGYNKKWKTEEKNSVIGEKGNSKVEVMTGKKRGRSNSSKKK